MSVMNAKTGAASKIQADRASTDLNMNRAFDEKIVVNTQRWRSKAWKNIEGARVRVTLKGM